MQYCMRLLPGGSQPRLKYAGAMTVRGVFEMRSNIIIDCGKEFTN